mmetsp:Transcript_32255/g.58971  ORF Transcript_32255/g.58971 Transcript_32255/m.58971 type:complete len:207 (+) Transcript_32255:96-716(+)
MNRHAPSCVADCKVASSSSSPSTTSVSNSGWNPSASPASRDGRRVGSSVGGSSSMTASFRTPTLLGLPSATSTLLFINGEANVGKPWEVARWIVASSSSSAAASKLSSSSSCCCCCCCCSCRAAPRTSAFVERLYASTSSCSKGDAKVGKPCEVALWMLAIKSISPGTASRPLGPASCSGSVHNQSRKSLYLTWLESGSPAARRSV